MSIDLLALAPIAVFALAALFATLAAMKRRALLDYVKRIRSA